MPFALYRENVRVSHRFTTELELWKYIRENGLCQEAIESEFLPTRRVLNSSYMIYECRADSETRSGPPRQSWR